jgi:hypothetical protein
VDSNQNQLPDDWEAEFGITNPQGDQDQDGLTNLQEWSAATSPVDPHSKLHLTGLHAVPGGPVTIEWASRGGVRYRILYSNGGPGGVYTGVFTPWVRPTHLEIAPGESGTPGSSTATDDFTVTGFPPHGARFYRIEVIR